MNILGVNLGLKDNSDGEHLKFAGIELGVMMGRKHDVNQAVDLTEATIQNTVDLTTPQAEVTPVAVETAPETQAPIAAPDNVIPMAERVVRAGLSQEDASRDLISHIYDEIDAETIEEFNNASSAA